MVGLNNIREAYQQVYSQLDERMDPEERALRRAEIADKKASRMDSKVAKKYSDSESKSAEREDKKSKGKHIHGMADSVEVDGDLVDEGLKSIDTPEKANQYAMKALGSAVKATLTKDKKTYNKRLAGLKMGQRKAERKAAELGEEKNDSYLETDMKKRQKNNEKAIEAMKKTKAHADMVKAARKHFEEVQTEESYMDYAKRKKAETKDTRMTVTAADKKANTTAWQKYKAGDKRYKSASHVGEETLLERPLDTAEKGEKERLVKGMKKSATDFKKRYGERAKSVMYATATKMAKHNMDTSKSDRRYAVEETSMEESVDVENRKKGPRTPSQLAKREKLKMLMDKIKSDKNSESN